MLTFGVFPCFPEKGYVFYGVGDVKVNKNIWQNLGVIFVFFTFVFQKIGTFGGKSFRRNRNLWMNDP